MRKYSIHIGIIVLIMMILLGCGKKVVNTKQAGHHITQRVVNYIRKTTRRISTELRKQDSLVIEQRRLKNEVYVLATEPSWNIKSYVPDKQPFNLVSGMVLGEYDVNLKDASARNPLATWAGLNGEYLSQVQGNNSSAEVFIHLGTHGDFGRSKQQEKIYKDFWDNDKLGSKLSQNLKRVLDTLTVTGIVIDFENLPQNTGKKYMSFLEELNYDFPNHTLILKLPAKDKNKNFSTEVLTGLKGIIDRFIVKAYEFQEGKSPEPIAPISKINSCIQGYNDLGIPFESMLLEIPYYGWVWEGNNLDEVRPFLAHDTLMSLSNREYIRAETEDGVYFEREGKSYWFDDEETLAKKYRDIVLAKKLGGIHIRGLGYHMYKPTSKNSLWYPIDKAFGLNPPKLVYPAIAFLLMFVVAGIVLSVVWYWKVRNELAKNRWQFAFYMIGLILTSIVMACCLIVVIPPIGTAGSSLLLVLFPFLRRIKSMTNRWL